MAGQLGERPDPVMKMGEGWNVTDKTELELLYCYRPPNGYPAPTAPVTGVRSLACEPGNKVRKQAIINETPQNVHFVK